MWSLFTPKCLWCFYGFIDLTAVAEEDFQWKVERIWTLLRNSMALPKKSQQ